MSGPLRLTFVQSASRVDQLPESPAEVAFVGRSNVGKSSLVNALANRKQLARVSNTPGRTQLINMFEVESARADTATMVDLPGYGFAKAAKTVKRDWPEMIEGYLLERDKLAMVFVLVDGPIGPTKLDAQMLDWLRYHGVPHTVVATKFDKVKSSKRATRKKELAAGCQLDQGDIVWVSAAKGDGIDALRSLVRTWVADFVSVGRMPLVDLPSVSITGTGLFIPPESVSNAELVASLTEAVLKWNAEHAEEIASGEVAERAAPDEEFIVKASGIERRYVMEKSGVLDPARMRPRLETRGEDELGIQAEMSLPAVREALAQAGRAPTDVDAVIVGCSNLQRAYPAVAIEIQDALGADGWGYDMNVACSSATFSVQAAVDALRNGSANCVVVVNPEITSGHNNFEMRDFHFIFGDACTALVLERTADATSTDQWEVLGTKLVTKFSNNIRNDFGFLNSSEVVERDPQELVFRQNGQMVFREVCPMVAEHINDHLAQLDLVADDVRRFWLHQANLKMNQLIAKGVLGRLPTEDEAPVILDEFANTSSAGSVIAFHRHRDDLAPGDVGVLCSFGAGYSVGSVVVRRR